MGGIADAAVLTQHAEETARRSSMPPTSRSRAETYEIQSLPTICRIACTIAAFRSGVMGLLSMVSDSILL